MKRPLSTTSCLASFPLWLSCLFLFLLNQVIALQHGSHHHHNHLHHRAIVNSTTADTARLPLNTAPPPHTDAEKLVRKALDALSAVNKARLENPRLNKYEFRRANRQPPKPPSILEFADVVPKSPSPAMPTSILAATAGSTAARVHEYSIPPELVEAARVLAEASPPERLVGNHSLVAAQVQAKYRLKTNDTNTPPQSYVRPNGLEGYIVSGDNLQQVITTESNSTAILEKRATPQFWMASMQQRGSSPFAPAGYKVWRNVKEYGAKGDGVTDDTTAINSAISDGNRCGDNCGSSTIYPAIVYFPAGTYLVSSSIIQYYNTQFLGDPYDYPTILAASSFVGLGVFSSNVYHEGGSGSEWYLNTNNFLRSIKNFKMDIRRTNPDAYGIFMENGSGGFLSNLTFVGGNFGAYFGNQQFTTSHLIFVNCKTALQVHWDWAWTMQDIIIESCGSGLVVTGGAGGTGSTGQSVGSLLLVDSIIANTPVGISTSLHGRNSTSLLVQNTGFFNVPKAITEAESGDILLPGGNEVMVDSWGAFGAKGDGETDDTAVLNGILSRAANMSSVVFFPFGVYVIKNTLQVPVGSRIVGQAWSQIMATGPKFADDLNPKVAVQVGKAGDTGIIEIQDMMFTVSGPTAGAILMEWNVRESSPGSAGMWDAHFRVGGAIGSKLQRTECPKLTGTVNNACKAASMLLHLTPRSSAYLENLWAWVADHDLDVVTQDQIDIYAARGILIESQGPTWLYGTSSEHNVLYQYQVSGAKDLLLSMIQTESPYFQPVPTAPKPFRTGLFPNDPSFKNCPANSTTCASSWALRVLDSTSTYILGAGLYSWFSNYNQDCVKTDNCQDRGVEIEESTDIWFFNLVTKAIVEMVTPKGTRPTYAAENKNGYTSSLLAWVRDKETTIGERMFPGFHLYENTTLSDITQSCRTAVTQRIDCHPLYETWILPSYHGTLPSQEITDSLCDEGCKSSLKDWFDAVSIACAGQNITGALPTILGGYLYQGYNETCLKDPATGSYCNDVIDGFTVVPNVNEMPQSELCSYCYTKRLEIMQSSSYSVYNEDYKHAIEVINSKCGLSLATELPPSPVIKPPPPPPICVSDMKYTIQDGDTCDSIALAQSVSSAALFSGNSEIIHNCSRLPVGSELCLPLTCEKVYTLQSTDNCTSIEIATGTKVGGLRAYNNWINMACTNLHFASQVHGHILCLAPQAGTYTPTGVGPGTTPNPIPAPGYTRRTVAPPVNATVAAGTTMECGKWYTIVEGDTCAAVCTAQLIPAHLFWEVNPSLSTTACDPSLMVGTTYCVGPVYNWDHTTTPVPTPTPLTTVAPGE
ncbi:hypothetical protein UREG_04770 [Uncinocarpus reesii 1704]|uniref:LysM domain-containing protein n=1 Tax=Uncinocarpus reesii (strain UAMH 1704) TaxID=336963 RepID=C4JUG7_UNCRE|nr:uncharacterized protein UREG_04770 [Uncinocarpus reesii 1704]EEP79928.1 hypothetical protein UREG_04770 [Uncinocarpus reesii 1704]